MSKILVVDDEQFNIDVIKRLLPKEFEIETASNGKDALLKAKKMRLDLILLDVIMPGLNGFEVCKKLKKNKKTMYIPVVFVTSLTEKEDMIRGIESGADDFLSKPVDMYELNIRVKSLLRVNKYHNELQEKNKYIVVIYEYLDKIRERTASLAAEMEELKRMNLICIESLRNWIVQQSNYNK